MEAYVRLSPGGEVRAAGPAAVTCDGVQFAVNQVSGAAMRNQIE